jgi:hypothetical protein
VLLLLLLLLLLFDWDENRCGVLSCVFVALDHNGSSSLVGAGSLRRAGKHVVDCEHAYIAVCEAKSTDILFFVVKELMGGNARLTEFVDAIPCHILESE